MDLDEPRSSVLRARRAIATVGATVAPGDVRAFFRRTHDLMASSPRDFDAWLDDLSRAAKADAAQDARYAHVLRFAGEQSARVPHLALAAWTLYPREAHAENVILPLRYLRAAAEGRGEARAEDAMIAIQNVCSSVYEPYLRCLVHLAHAADENPVPPHERFGALVEQARTALGAYPGLLDDQTVLFRNAAAHGCRSARGNPGDWTYDDLGESITVWDSAGSPTTITVEKLVERTVAAWQLAGQTFFRVRDLLTVRVLAEVLSAPRILDLARGIAEEDAALASRSADEIEAAIARLVTPARVHLQKLFARRAADLAARDAQRQGPPDPGRKPQK